MAAARLARRPKDTARRRARHKNSPPVNSAHTVRPTSVSHAPTVRAPEVFSLFIIYYFFFLRKYIFEKNQVFDYDFDFDLLWTILAEPPKIVRDTII